MTSQTFEIRRLAAQHTRSSAQSVHVATRVLVAIGTFGFEEQQAKVLSPGVSAEIVYVRDFLSCVSGHDVRDCPGGLRPAPIADNREIPLLSMGPC